MEWSEPRLTVAEYFAGIGLVRMGLERHGWKVVFANDISPKKYQMYEAFFPDAAAHYLIGDIFKVRPEGIPPTCLATCSFPCIDLSLAGNMEGIGGSHSSAFWGFAQILRQQGEHGPSLLLVENVPGWLNSNGGEDFRTTVRALNRLGYACDVFMLDALRFTPQSRLRVFLLGAKRADSPWAADRILARPKELISETLVKCIERNRDLKWFYHPFPSPPPLRTSGLSDIVEQLPDEDERWWPSHEVGRHLAMMNDAHRQRVTELAPGEKFSYRTFYRRRREGSQRAEVRDDELAGCLRTAIGGSGKQFLIRAGRGQVRMRAMTPREYARLQGVPDTAPITVNGVQALTGFGDAVCVPAIAWVAEHGLTPLASKILPGHLGFKADHDRQPLSG